MAQSFRHRSPVIRGGEGVPGDGSDQGHAGTYSAHLQGRAQGRHWLVHLQWRMRMESIVLMEEHQNILWHTVGLCEADETV